MEKDNGKLVIFSAPSGAGKTTIVQYLLETFPQLEFSVSACSREKRKGETHGVDYYFLSITEFKEKIKNNEFAEWEEVYKDHFYGTLKSEIERIWNKGKHIIFDMDVVGGLNLKKLFEEKALAVFVMPPSIGHLETRLKLRETETAESIARRIGKAEEELRTSIHFDKIILNDDLEKAFVEAKKITSEFISQ
jgi:guanylate kinase